MSYNVSSVDTPVLKAWMRACDITRLCRELKPELPESDFLRDHKKKAQALIEEGLLDARVDLVRFWWSSEGSGRSYEEVLQKKIAPFIHGRVEAIFTWEGGDSHSGLIIEDGKVTECDVQLTLVPKKP